MSKVTFVKKIHHRFLVSQLAFPETVSDRALSIVNSTPAAGFLPVEAVRKGSQATLTCVLDHLLPVKEYLGAEITKRKFFGIVSTILRAVHFCQKNQLREDNLDLQSDRILIDPASGHMLLVYWPVVNNSSSVPVQNYLRACIEEFQFDPREDSGWRTRYQEFFESGKPFSLNAYEDMVLELSGMGAPKKKNIAPQERTSADASRETVTLNFVPPVPSAFDPFAAVEKRSRAIQEDHLAGEHSGAGAVSGPGLLRTSTGQWFSIDGPSFTIGSMRESCRLCITDNPSVSRVHAEILLRFGRYYIVDRGSRNGTSVNGSFIRPGDEVELAENAVLHLADEEFRFFTK